MDQIELLKLTILVLERLKIPYALVGSFGSSIFGEPRFTRDIDMLIELPPSKIAAFCAEFPDPEFYLSAPAVQDAVRGRFQFNLLHPSSGNKVDFILPRNDSWGKSQLSRARRVRIRADLEGFVCAPEDVILGKLWYFSEGGGERHLRDIAGILRVAGESVDRTEIERWATELGYLEIWRQVATKVDGPKQSPGAGIP